MDRSICSEILRIYKSQTGCPDNFKVIKWRVCGMHQQLLYVEEKPLEGEFDIAGNTCTLVQLVAFYELPSSK